MRALSIIALCIAPLVAFPADDPKQKEECKRAPQARATILAIPGADIDDRRFAVHA